MVPGDLGRLSPRSIVVEEATDDRNGYVGRGDVVEEAGKKFEEALATLRPATLVILTEIAGMTTEPRRDSVKTGLFAER